MDLNKVRAAVFAMDGFEERELTEPVKALRNAGAQVDIISLKLGKIQAFNHFDKTIQIDVNRVLSEVDPNEFDLLVLPGGALNADTSRIIPEVQTFVRAFHEASKPMAVICHAPWILVSSGLVAGRTLTAYKTIQDDIRNANGNWIDQEVVVDQNWVTSRQPADLPAFIREIFNLISRYQRPSAEKRVA